MIESDRNNQLFTIEDAHNFEILLKKAKSILENLAWKYIKIMEVKCNHVEVDLSNMAILFINKSVLGNKIISGIYNIPFVAFSSPDEWLNKEIDKAKNWDKNIKSKIQNRKKLSETLRLDVFKKVENYYNEPK